MIRGLTPGEHQNWLETGFLKVIGLFSFRTPPILNAVLVPGHVHFSN